MEPSDAPEAPEPEAPTPESEAPAPPDDPDRRREYRLNKVLGAEIVDEQQTQKARLFVINISRTGFRATNQFPLPLGEPLQVKLALTAKIVLDTTVKVVWQKELTVSGMFDLGFEFQGLSEENWEALTRFIEAEVSKVKEKTLDLKSIWAFGEPRG